MISIWKKYTAHHWNKNDGFSGNKRGFEKPSLAATGLHRNLHTYKYISTYMYQKMLNKKKILHGEHTLVWFKKVN